MTRRVFDAIIVVTDRLTLDKQIKDTIKQFVQVGLDSHPRGPLRRPASGHRVRQEDHHHHGAEVPVHLPGDRSHRAGRK